MKLSKTDVVWPDWPAPTQVVAFSTTRLGGVSTGDYQQLNLGLHVGDNQAHVATNRARLQHFVGEDTPLVWLHQVHGDAIADAATNVGMGSGMGSVTDSEMGAAATDRIEADACVCAQPNLACVVMTADCLPVLLCNAKGTQVAALHCGWRGLYQGLIGKTRRNYFSDEPVIAWLGPAIGPQSYEVDDAFYQRFVALDAGYASAFYANRSGHYWCDLYAIARYQLHAQGIASVYGGGFDTLSDSRFFSYRQQTNAEKTRGETGGDTGRTETGRMATVIFIQNEGLGKARKG
ncbi:peptidoglycan editing factor PgeF [Ostreibacterium oceani]|uniref:Purine nucleoside phosphorylase n=1 Tax=Ostreibacterium oceani TaxID=2654998 RepID=A0A6N7ET77_9GAMM|nr:peptidoglycan editing factor PgeF [Ostreibacterium oceani]MPV86044.1 peptidoglycan editing factor PgeF [Ostreibacterium oceani]